MMGELVPEGGGDTIPLLKERLLIGRRESCDIVLRFSNVSAHHCQLFVESGYWFIKDLKSRNGTKVNGRRIARKRIDPGDTVAVAKHTYKMVYDPLTLGANGPPPPDEETISSILGHSLLDRAGLKRRAQPDSTSRKPAPKKTSSGADRYDLLDDDPGQPDRNKPV
jgi:adenylate cyclase